MMKIGIDFSIKSPAFSIRDSEGTLTFSSVPRESTIKDDTLISLEKAGVNVVCLPDEKPLPKKSTIAERERSSLEDAIMQISACSSIIETIKTRDYVGVKSEYETALYVGIEGFSFASTGNRLAQISGYQWLFRYLLYTKHGMTSANFHVYSPMTVKATAGKGNYKKDEMIAAFLTSEDPALRATSFWQEMTNNPAQFQTKKGAWVKPIDDIVDSYWVLRTLENNLGHTNN